MTRRPNSKGIRTLDHLRDRCFVDVDTGCWHWRLSFHQGSPRVHAILPSGEKIILRGRRAGLVLQRGADLPAGQMGYARLICTTADCVNPAHAQSGTREQHGAYMRASGRAAPSQAKLIAATANSRKRACVKLDMEKARAIRSSDKSTRALAREHNVPQSHIQNIKVGRAWRESPLTMASVFAMAGAL